MIRPHTKPSRKPSHRRSRSSRFGGGLCMEKHKVSYMCYLSKMHFVRDFPSNPIGNSPTSTHLLYHLHCEETILKIQSNHGMPSATHPPAPLGNPIYIAGHDPTVTNHTEILSTAHARKQVKPHYTAEPIRS